MIFLHPGLGYKDFFFIILYLKFNKRSLSVSNRNEHEFQEGVQKVFGTLDLFVSLLETEIKYPILQGGILPFWTPSLYYLTITVFLFISNCIFPVLCISSST